MTTKNVNFNQIFGISIITAPLRSTAKVMFLLCVSVHKRGGGGYPEF